MHALSGRFEAGAHVLRCDIGPNRTGVVRHDGLLSAIVGAPHFLEPHLHRIASESGVATALAVGYRAHGVDVLKHIAGKFSLAVIDTQDESALLAIDRSGIATLCYSICASVVSFGLNAEDVRVQSAGAEIDPRSVFDYLFCHSIPSPATIFHGISRLEPGHCVRVAKGVAHVSSYHENQYEENDTRSFEDLRATFLGLLRVSVRDAIFCPEARTARPCAAYSQKSPDLLRTHIPSALTPPALMKCRTRASRPNISGPITMSITSRQMISPTVSGPWRQPTINPLATHQHSPPTIALGWPEPMESISCSAAMAATSFLEATRATPSSAYFPLMRECRVGCAS